MSQDLRKTKGMLLSALRAGLVLEKRKDICLSEIGEREVRIGGASMMKPRSEREMC